MFAKLRHVIGLTGAVVAAATLIGCESTPRDPDDVLGSGGTRWLGGAQPVAEPMPAPAPAPQPRPAPRMTGDCAPNVPAGMNVASMAFPTGDVRSSAIMLHQVMPVQVRRNSEFAYEYHVCNLTNAELQNVVLTQDSSSNLNVRSSEPSAQAGPGGQNWILGNLAPGETRIIRVSATASEVGMASNCISVSYNNVLCAATEVVDPALTLEKTATPNALACDQIEIVYTVCNPGTGIAENVRIIDELPAGLVTAAGSRSVNFDIGSLAPGQCREQRLVVEATGPGRFSSPARATADGGLSADAAATTTVVTAPELAISCDSRASQFIGRNAEHTFTVTNNGDGPANNASVTVNVNGGSIVRSSGGVAGGNSVTFNLGNMAPGASETVSVTVSSSTRGVVSTRATATSFCAEPVSTSCETEFRGIPAILLEVVDLVDPVEVGTQTTYRITVTNQGSADDRNVTIEATLPGQLEFVSASGATSESIRGNTISFAPFPVLAPGQRISWDVVVRAIGEGDVRFALEMTSDELTSPVRETEATQLYE